MIFWGEGWIGDELMDKFHCFGDIDLSRLRWDYQLEAVVIKQNAYTPSFLAVKFPIFSIRCFLMDHYWVSKRTKRGCVIIERSHQIGPC